MTGSELRKLSGILDIGMIDIGLSEGLSEIAFAVILAAGLVLLWQVRIHFPLFFRLHPAHSSFRHHGGFYVLGGTSLLLALAGLFRPLLPQRALLSALSPSTIDESEARLAAIARQSEDIIFSVDLSGKVLTWNHGAEKTFGYSADEIIGHTTLRLSPPETHDAVRRVYEQLKEGKPLLNYQAWKLKKGGERVLIAFTLSPVSDRNGNRSYYSVIGRDVTDLHYRQLEAQAQALSLSRSNQDLEQFAYVASHDLQEPLRMITSYLTLVHQRYQHQLDKDAEEFINYAVGGAKRMKSLIEGLLSYSRIGCSSMSFGKVETAAVVKEVLLQLKDSIEAAEASIELQGLPHVNGDSTQIFQLFQNLIANSLKFASGPKPEIRVCGEQKQHEWLFSVSDNGIGINPNQKDRIFLMFQRLHTQEQYPGSGIGLAVCKKIVERHGGRIWVTSTEGRGSTFWFTLGREPFSV